MGGDGRERFLWAGSQCCCDDFIKRISGALKWLYINGNFQPQIIASRG